jgi:sulfide dehydrogenase cytochrome subunit
VPNDTGVPAKAGTRFPAARTADRRIPVFAGVMMLLVGSTTAAAAELSPPGASSCSGCHAASAPVEMPVPRLVGRPAADIIAAMQQFRTGDRPATVMDRIAKGFSDEEAAAIAAWYAGQKQ